MLQIFRKRPGFGLLEAVIASGVIVVLSSVTVGISHVIVTKSSDFDSKIVASNLAESGIEAAYTIRDRNLNDKNPDTAWDNGITGPDLSTGVAVPALDCKIPTISSSAIVTQGILGNNCGLSVDDSLLKDNSEKVTLKYVSRASNPQEINYNGKTYVREIFMQKSSPEADLLDIRSVVFLKPDDGANIEILSDISDQLTNWKDTDTSERSDI